MDDRLNNQDVHRKALELFDEAYEADLQNREEAIDDLEFASGEHWPDSVKSAREGADRPVMTMNRMQVFLNRVKGLIRRQNPAIKVVSANSEAQMAEIYEGLIRHIEHQSDAVSVYEGSAENSASCGIGNFRVITDYAEPEALEQEIFLEAIPNPLAVHWDPNAKDPTRKDARHCWIVDRLTNDEFREEHPGASLIDWEGKGQPEYLRHWFDQDTVLICEYFTKRKRKVKLGVLENGATIDLSRNKSLVGVLPMQEREIEVDEVYWYKMSGAEILEGPVLWPGRHIPVVCVPGEEIHIGERVRRHSVIRFAKDAQRLLNYAISTRTEALGLQTKAPWLVTDSHVEGHETEWDNAHLENYPYLKYNPDVDGAPPPSRIAPPITSQGFDSEIQMAMQLMKDTTGIQDAALGQKSNETSGIAIQERQEESDVATSIYIDNLKRAIGQAGRIIVDLIPKIYDTERQIRILGEDLSEKIVKVNQQLMINGQPFAKNDLSRGRYDIRVSTGPNFITLREQAVQQITAFIQAYPQAGPFVMDIVARNADWPGADEIAERLKRAVPQELLSPEEREEIEQDPQAQQQVAAAAQMQQQQIKAMQAKAAIELGKEQADLRRAEAVADKAQLEVYNAQIEAAMQSPPVQAMLAQIIGAQIQTILGQLQPDQASGSLASQQPNANPEGVL